ncbi:hypothetical protein LLG95_08030 [bacterium]|nr:hypothetical protein [bacterium]
MYNWRKLTPDQREIVMAERQRQRYPWHRPPHFSGEGNYLISAACYEHAHFIGTSNRRMTDFEQSLMTAIMETPGPSIFAWCVLPNHYHVLLYTEDLDVFADRIGQLHGRTSHDWNGEDRSRGRQVWHSCTDRRMRSEKHFWATMNYVHNNPVKHGYVSKWQDWPFSSARDFLGEYNSDDVIRLWRDYPLKDYGKGWDDPDM